jgi:outer membrane biosynthesis protein TonB
MRLQKDAKAAKRKAEKEASAEKESEDEEASKEEEPEKQEEDPAVAKAAAKAAKKAAKAEKKSAKVRECACDCNFGGASRGARGREAFALRSLACLAAVIMQAWCTLCARCSHAVVVRCTVPLARAQKAKKDKEESDSEEEEEPKAKEVVEATEEDAEMGEAAEEEQAEEPAAASNGHANGSANGKQTTGAKAFQRVKADEWLGAKAARSNTYVDTFGEDGWGAKAQAVLGAVRGKDFRHEKTKKKRGSYMGGLIDANATASFKYDSDDE